MQEKMNTSKKSTLINFLTTDEKCEFCGENLKGVETYLFGSVQYFPCPCKCSIEKNKKRVRENMLRQEKEKLDRMYSQSNLGERFKESTFENFQTTENSIDIYNRIKDYAYNFKDKYKSNSIIMYGQTGTGKTHLAGAVVNHLIRKYISAIFVIVPDLLTQIRNSFTRDYKAESEQKLINGLKKCTLLVLDDLGAEHRKSRDDWANSILTQIINSRYSDKKATIITTNCTVDEIFANYEERFFSRINEMTKGFRIEMKNIPDMRMTDLN